MSYVNLSAQELKAESGKLLQQYNEFLNMKLNLDMSRGKPCKEQLDMSDAMLRTISDSSECISEAGTDCRNYGLVDGIPLAKELFSQIIGVGTDEIIIGGNSSLNLMYDAVARYMLYGVQNGEGPWCKQEKVKFICVVPGYDRHFGICQSLGIEMVNVNMTSEGPDMDAVEELVKDRSVKGIWCVPKYSNPDGTTYSDETVRRIARLKPASPDFRIFWDNAYVIHDLYDETVPLLNILDECKKCGNENLPLIFASTSKVTYPGSGVSVIGASKENIDYIKSIMNYQTIGHDKMNMLRHVKYFGTAENMRKYMKLHAEILRPKFEVVIKTLEKELASLDVATWSNPRGGYFISLDVCSGCAKRTVALAQSLGVKLTAAGSTYPYFKDPEDKNIRIAPSFPTVADLSCAINVVCLCVKIATIEKLLNETLIK